MKIFFPEIKQLLDSAVIPGIANHKFQTELEWAKRLILGAKATNTTKTYLSHIRRFAVWAKARDVCWIPASRSSILAFVGFLGQSKVSAAILTGSRAAIGWMHHAAGLDNPVADPLVSLCFQGAVRNTIKSEKTPPFSKGSLVVCLKRLKNSNMLDDLRMAVILIFLFYGFLRIGEALGLAFRDVTCSADAVKVYIRSSKTDQGGKGQLVLISRGEGPLSPVSIVSDYISKLTGKGYSSEYPFFPVFRPPQPNRCRLSYDSALKEFRSLQKRCSIKSKFGFHSLRAGGVSAAANAGLDSSLLQKHGRWKSAETMLNHYMNFDVPKQLSVSKVLLN